jgi:hypothetical protein
MAYQTKRSSIHVALTLGACFGLVLSGCGDSGAGTTDDTIDPTKPATSTTVDETTGTTGEATSVGPSGSESATGTSGSTGSNSTGVEPNCTDGAEQCGGDGHQLCVDGQWADDPCDAGQFCDQNNGACATCFCDPGAEGACVDMDNIEVCNDECSAYEGQSCGLTQICVGDACVEKFCDPGVKVCDGDEAYAVCNGDGTDYMAPVDCAFGELCNVGECVAACQLVEDTNSSEGCEFWAVDLPNHGNMNNFAMAVAVGNPSTKYAVDVSIYDGNNNGQEQLLIQETIQPRQVKRIPLAGQHGNFQGYYNSDAGFQGTGIGYGRAFRIESNLPVIATQWNPIGGSSGYTGEASLLLPTHALATDYIDLGWHEGATNQPGSFMVVVATENNTQVQIKPAIPVPATQDTPAMNPANFSILNIDRYDYIQVSVDEGLDLSGSIIDTSKPTAVFGGHRCAYVPTYDPNNGLPYAWCDHLEEQLLPLEAWGNEYMAVRAPPRTPDPNEAFHPDEDWMAWRIVGSKDNTVVNFEPSIEIGDSVNIDAGDVIQFESSMDFHVSSNEPILIAAYMPGGKLYLGNEGDPYMVQMVPIQQYRDDYVFLSDESYDNDYAKLIRPTGAAISVGCLGVVPENKWSPVGNSGYDIAVIDMQNDGNCNVGANEATSDEKFGIIVSGTATAASYGYPGGLVVDKINPLD